MTRCGLVIIALFLLVGLPLPGRSQEAATVSTGPDVLVLIVQRPGLGDQVNITYSGLVPHVQVQQDLNALRVATGWARTGLTISDDRAPVRQIRYLTGATFTAPNVVLNETHTLPVEPFITAFHLRKSLALIFITDSNFQFQGWRQYADNNVNITLDQHGSAYTYRVAILNPQFVHLNFPGTAQAAAAITNKHRARVSPGLLLLGIVLAAAAAGILVYIAALRLSPTSMNAEQSPTEQSPADHQRSEKETLLGPGR